jgi:hypothetical protein
VEDVDPDLELFEHWRAGDQRAGQDLFARHFSDIHAFFRHKTDRRCEILAFATPEVRDRTEAMWNVDPLVPAVLKEVGGPPLVRYKFLINASFLFYQLQRLTNAYSDFPRTDLWIVEAAASLHHRKFDEMREVVAAVNGRAAVLMDGGIRRGSDIVSWDAAPTWSRSSGGVGRRARWSA